ncbi:DUF2061 domain-containing protein [Hyphococcus sp. DH-69]
MSYGVMHFCVAVIVAFAVTRSWVAALGVGLVEPVIQTVAYTLHERAWARRGRSASGVTGQSHFGAGLAA